MDNKDIIVRQAAKILELEDALSKKSDSLESQTQSANYWYNEYQRLKVIPAPPVPQGDSNA